MGTSVGCPETQKGEIYNMAAVLQRKHMGIAIVNSSNIVI